MLLDELAPPGGATEAFTWLITAVVTGVAGGTALGGTLVSGGQPSRGFAAAVVAAALSWLAAYLGRPLLQSSPRLA